MLVLIAMRGSNTDVKVFANNERDGTKGWVVGNLAKKTRSALSSVEVSWGVSASVRVLLTHCISR